MDYSDQVFHSLIGGGDGVVLFRPRFDRLANNFRSRQLLASRDAHDPFPCFIVETECQWGSHDVTSPTSVPYYSM
jgi:hypothetical protein